MIQVAQYTTHAIRQIRLQTPKWRLKLACLESSSCVSRRTRLKSDSCVPRHGVSQVVAQRLNMHVDANVLLHVWQ